MTSGLLATLRARVTRADGIRLVASLVLATLLWGYVSLVTDPEQSQTFRALELPKPELPGELLITTQLPTVDVRLTGPRSVIRDIGAGEVSASLDTSGVDEPGQYTVPVRVERPDGVRRTRPTPGRITIQVERTATKQLDLTVPPPSLGENDSRQVGQIGPDVSTVTVSGPESAVNRVARVELPVELGEHTRDFEESVTPIAYDASGVAVPEVTITPSSIQTTVAVSQRGKTVAVLTQVEGAPAPGFEVISQRSNPGEVIVDGPPDVLSDTIVVYTEPVDISGATSDVTERVPIDPTSLPEGVRIVAPSNSQVEVIIQVGQRAVSQPLTGQAIDVVGLAPGLTAALDPEELAVVVETSQQQILALQPGDIVVSVNLAGLEPGVYTLTPTVSVPSNMRWERTDPGQVTVTITALPAFGNEQETDIGSDGGEASPVATPRPLASPVPSTSG